MAKKRLGELLLERGVITLEQLNDALAAQRLWGQRLGAVLVAKGIVAEGTLTRSLAESLRIPMVDLSKVTPEPKALLTLPAALAEEHEVFPVAVKDHRGRKTLLLAMADPLNMNVIDEVAFRSSLHVRPAIAQLSSLRAAIRKFYRNQAISIPALNYEKVSQEEALSFVTHTGHENIIDFESNSHASAPPPLVEAPKNKEAKPRTVGTPLEHLQTPEPPPYMQQEQSDFEIEQVAGQFDQTTGVYMVQSALDQGEEPLSEDALSEMFPSGNSIELEQLESLERKFWALMRVLSRNGVVTREMFLDELTRTY